MSTHAYREPARATSAEDDGGPLYRWRLLPGCPSCGAGPMSVTAHEFRENTPVGHVAYFRCDNRLSSFRRGCGFEFRVTTRDSIGIEWPGEEEEA